MKSREVRIATVSFLIKEETATIDQNIEQALSYIDKAGKERADIVCLPEWFNIYNTEHFKDKEKIKLTAEIKQGKLLKLLSQKARQNRMYIVATYPVKEENRIYNQATIIGRKGEIIGYYRKVQPTAMEYTNLGIIPGDVLPVFNLDFGKIAVTICMDIYFPEIVRIYSFMGAEIVFWPTMASGPTEDNLVTMCRCRAMDNSVYMVSSNYACEEPYAPYAGGKKSLVGRAFVVDYDGNIIADTGHKEGVVIASIDLDKPRLTLDCIGIRTPDYFREDMERLVRLDFYAKEYIQLSKTQKKRIY